LAVAAGTVMITSSVPEAHGPDTVHLNTYVPSIKLLTLVELDDGDTIEGTFGPLIIDHVPDCPPIPQPPFDPDKSTYCVEE
jgi:hypothetical protein